ncbi:MAG: ribosome small subunit-dependent GTPase A [Ureaplasma sp.]|nr:ribosome small subunit-dependent GTPase A [Ureaplasma sp.]
MKSLKGTVYSFIGGIANVKTETNEMISCKPLGIFKFKNKNNSIICGDKVLLEFNEDVYQITEIFPRKNELIRPKVSNIDSVLIIQSVIEPNLNRALLNKYLMFYEYHIDNVWIAFSKTDLLSKEKYEEFLKIKNEFSQCGYLVFDLNNLDEFKKLLSSFNNKLICLVGNSGVGKSTFLNRINPNLLLRVQEISKSLNRGKHTTTNVGIIDFNNYSIIDTPGFSSLDLNFSKEQIAIGWQEFRNYASKCKYSNCLHLTEPNCEIKNMLKSGKILEFRYNDYCYFLKNSK